jgi:hypothetical protein
MIQHQVAIVAQIRAGKRAELNQLIHQGPPFDLAEHGFTRHEAFLGDDDIVLIFKGTKPATDTKRLISILGAGQLAKLGMLVSTPRMLTESFEWQPTLDAAHSI